MEFVAGAGVVLTAVALGVTHGIEPDHVAGISALTHEADDPGLSALVGACFAAGHVVLVLAWIGIAWGLLGLTSFPQFLERVGLLFVGVVLAGLGLYLGVSGTRRFLHRHVHAHDDAPHSHYHLHRPTWLRVGAHHAQEHHHRHDAVAYLQIGMIGALFTLSPPVSMIAFISVTMGAYGLAEIGVVVVAYAVAIVVTMGVVGGGAGAAFRRLHARGERVHAAAEVGASLLVLGFAATLLVHTLPVAIG